MQTAAMRERQVNIRFNEEEGARAERVARAHGLNIPNVIRLLLKREDDALRALEDGQRAVMRELRGSGVHLSPKQIAGNIGRTIEWTKRVLGELEELDAVHKDHGAYMLGLKGLEMLNR